MLHSLRGVVNVPTPSRASLAPTGSVAIGERHKTVGASGAAIRLAREGPSASMKMSGLGQRRQIPNQPQRLTHEQRLGLRHLVNHLQPGITQPAHRQRVGLE